MKPKFIFLIFFLFCTLNWQKASAEEGLLMENCANGPSSPPLRLYRYSPAGSSNGMACDTIRNLNTTLSVVNLALLPAVTFVKNPAVSSALLADLASAGMTFANPVVLGVTIVGGVGIATFYVVLRQSLEDCERQDQEALKQQILNEIRAKYGAVAAPDVPLEFRN